MPRCVLLYMFLSINLFIFLIQNANNSEHGYESVTICTEQNASPVLFNYDTYK